MRWRAFHSERTQLSERHAERQNNRAGAIVAVIARVTGAVVLWLIAFVVADVQTATDVDDAIASADDGPGFLRYAIAIAGVLALGGLILLASRAVNRRRNPADAPVCAPVDALVSGPVDEPLSGPVDEPVGDNTAPAPRQSVGAGSATWSSRGPGPTPPSFCRSCRPGSGTPNPATPTGT